MDTTVTQSQKALAVLHAEERKFIARIGCFMIAENPVHIPLCGCVVPCFNCGRDIVVPYIGEQYQQHLDIPRLTIDSVSCPYCQHKYMINV